VNGTILSTLPFILHDQTGTTTHQRFYNPEGPLGMKDKPHGYHKFYHLSAVSHLIL
jgi:hypothetical protein